MRKTLQKPRIQRTEKEKLDLIEQWEQSGLPILTFCRQHHFSDSVFHSWLNKYRRHHKKTPTPESDFIALPITAPSTMPQDHCSLYAEIILKGGSHIRFYQPVSADYLRTLVA
jgi:transposase-like protein